MNDNKVENCSSVIDSIEDDYVILGDSKIKLPKNYNPLEDDGPYMNNMHLAYFKNCLLSWKSDLQSKIKETLDYISQDASVAAVNDEMDLVAKDAELFGELRTKDRYRKLIHKIDRALVRIETGSYGYCEKSGNSIGLRRLIARPIAMLSIEMQELHEKEEDIQESAEYTHRAIKTEVE